MKKSLVFIALALILFAGCTEEKKDAKEQVAPKQEVVQAVTKAEEQKVEEPKAEQKVEEKKEEAKVEPKAEEPKVEVKAEETTVTNDINAEALFKTCTSCHGAKGEKEALGKSQVIAGWDKDRVTKALNGYKDGSYGGVMKGIMKPHVETKTPEQISALAEFISKL